MSFAALRIKHDLENLAIPLGSATLRDYTLDFCLSLDAELYEGLYSFTLTFPPDYPFNSPRLLCHTPVFHPNIDDEGHVCLKVLREGWMPSYTVSSIVVSLLWAFSSPSSEDALNTEAGDLIETDYAEFKRRVKECGRMAP